MRKLIVTFRTAFRDARKNLLHTLLSVLGIVIGVGALVAILSLIDGLEEHAHEQISKTTSLESIIINTQTTKRVDNVWVNKDTYAHFNYQSFESLVTQLDDVKGYLIYQESGFIATKDSVDRGVLLTGIVETENEKVALLAGSFLKKTDLINKDAVALISKELVEAIDGQSSFKEWVGKPIAFKNKTYKIKGVIDSPSNNLQLYVPITLIPEEAIKSSPPRIVIEAQSIEAIPNLTKAIKGFLSNQFGENEKDFNIVTNEFRIKQANQGFLIFRLIMGLIVGISVLVGGIGVMNVLLISVNERTAEIGVRKAVGAKKKDIVLQFLSESLIISLIGSFLGVLLGVSFTLVAVPIVKHLAEIPFEAAYTLNTLLIISLVAIFIGVIFGTYPALKASRLDPVEAIRRE